MRKQALILAVMTIAFAANVRAGGLMTNTNYHIAFDRMMARGATFDIDAAYSNPAGLAWGHEGWQLSLNFQKPWQYRDIELTTQAGSHTYEGKASAPIVPALFASYKKDKWAISSMIGIVGSGGFVEYKEGVPEYNVKINSLLNNLIPQFNKLPGINISEKYAIDSEMKGKQYIYGGQFNFTYKLLDCLSAAVGMRVNYYDGYFRGHVIADEGGEYGQLARMLLDVDQKGWGFTPMISVNYHQGPLTLTARYEFRTKISTKNETNVLDAGLGDILISKVAAVPVYGPQTLATLNEKLTPTLSNLKAPFEDGVHTRYDMPALLSVAAGYEFTPKLRATLEYHFFDDKNAKMTDIHEMANNRQEKLEHGTHEILAGIEYDINDKFTVSCGGQRTDYGLSDGYQQNTSFACDSYSVGFGGAWNITEKVRLNAGYFMSIYSDYEKQASYGLETYSRTNYVVGLGVDYKF
ncbi:MAG: outer membrane beta-barrel protein [Prevotella sp.]|nr:outer membrane beta-barrel protein [Prevotella sp.]